MKIPASDHSDNASSHKEAPVAFATGSVIEDVAGCSILLRGSTPAQTLALQRLLATGGFRQVATVNGHVEAEQFLSRMKVDLLILSGFSTADGSFLKALRNSEVGLQIPVVAVATWDESLMELGLTSGVSDFVREPIVRHELFARVRNLLTLRRCRERLEHYTEDLERQVRRRTAELTASRAEIVRCLARAAEFRDDDTGLHVARVGRYAGLIARKLGFPESYVEILELAAQLHDIGKIGIPDEILHKPGSLDPEQYERIKEHCAIGHQIIQPLGTREWDVLRTHTRLGGSLLHVLSSPLLLIASKIAQTHHEHWDGRGYPLGLAGEDIPIEGRITAVADVYDALASARPYKRPFSRSLCFELLERGRGTHFDPKVLDAFFACREEIIQVQMDFMDPVR
jgi:putative two-component system response regulator